MATPKKRPARTPPSKELSRLKAATQDLPEKYALTSISQLPAWVKLAITRMKLDDLDVDKAAKLAKRAGITLRDYLKSPAAQEWSALIEEQANDPRTFARATLTNLTANITLDLLWAHDSMKEAGDVTGVAKSAQWLLARPELLGDVARDEKPTITINIGGGASIEPIEITSTHEETRDAEWEEEKRDGD